MNKCALQELCLHVVNARTIKIASNSSTAASALQAVPVARCGSGSIVLCIFFDFFVQLLVEAIIVLQNFLCLDVVDTQAIQYSIYRPAQ